MLNTYACPHPLNRLRQSKSAPEYLTCQDCLGTFSLELVCGHNLKGIAGQVTQGKTWTLVLAMRDDSKDATPLKEFIPAGVTIDQLRPRDVFAEAEASGPEQKWRTPGKA